MAASKKISAAAKKKAAAAKKKEESSKSSSSDSSSAEEEEKKTAASDSDADKAKAAESEKTEEKEGALVQESAEAKAEDSAQPKAEESPEPKVEGAVEAKADAQQEEQADAEKRDTEGGEKEAAAAGDREGDDNAEGAAEESKGKDSDSESKDGRISSRRLVEIIVASLEGADLSAVRLGQLRAEMETRLELPAGGLDAQKEKIGKLVPPIRDGHMAKVSEAKPVAIFGAQGEYAQKINGVYAAVGVMNGRVLYRKPADEDKWLRYVTKGGRDMWVVSETAAKTANLANCMIYCAEQGLEDPSKAKRWIVKNTVKNSSWVEQPVWMAESDADAVKKAQADAKEARVKAAEAVAEAAAKAEVKEAAEAVAKQKAAERAVKAEKAAKVKAAADKVAAEKAAKLAAAKEISDKIAAEKMAVSKAAYDKSLTASPGVALAEATKEERLNMYKQIAEDREKRKARDRLEKEKERALWNKHFNGTIAKDRVTIARKRHRPESESKQLSIKSGRKSDGKDKKRSRESTPRKEKTKDDKRKREGDRSGEKEKAKIKEESQQTGSQPEGESTESTKAEDVAREPAEKGQQPSVSTPTASPESLQPPREDSWEELLSGSQELGAQEKSQAMEGSLQLEQVVKA